MTAFRGAVEFILGLAQSSIWFFMFGKDIQGKGIRGSEIFRYFGEKAFSLNGFVLAVGLFLVILGIVDVEMWVRKGRKTRGFLTIKTQGGEIKVNYAAAESVVRLATKDLLKVADILETSIAKGDPPMVRVRVSLKGGTNVREFEEAFRKAVLLAFSSQLGLKDVRTYVEVVSYSEELDRRAKTSEGGEGAPGGPEPGGTEAAKAQETREKGVYRKEDVRLSEGGEDGQIPEV